MPVLNAALLRALAGISRTRADASVVVELGVVRRVLHLSRGELISADSTLRSDRLGSLLVARGKLDAALIEPVSEEARKRGLLLGEQLIQEGLLTPTELAKVLEEQVLLRFEGALTMAGNVSIAPKTSLSAVIRQPVGAALLAAFREVVALEALTPLLQGNQERFTQFPTDADVVSLQLQPSEVRFLRRLAGPETLSDILRGSPQPDRSRRVLAALVALELLR